MEIQLEPGTYVVAVSGGVDSMVLLDLLQQKPDLRLFVAHFDHGIRFGSKEDRKLVQAAAKKYGLKFIYDEGRLGADASEATARKARYDFLHKIRQASRAKAIITAHHQDDLLETAVLNMLRGTGRKGLTSLKNTSSDTRRPLLDISKRQLIDYAEKHALIWHEDITNQDLKYLRNYVRHKILPRFSEMDKKILLGIIKSLSETNKSIDHHLINHLHAQPAKNKLGRHSFIMLPHSVSREVMAEWLRRHDVKDVTAKSIERLIIAAKTLTPGQQADVDNRYVLRIGTENLALSHRDR